MFEFHVIESILSVLIAWKWGDWRNWRLYYSTILYMIVGDFTYIIARADRPLWKFESPLFSYTFIELLIAFICYPSTCLVFWGLYTKVKKDKKKVTALLLFAACLYTSFEWLSHHFGFISYYYGWSLYWSFLFNLIMFPLILLHFKKPLLVWPLSAALALIMMYFFKLPFAIMK